MRITRLTAKNFRRLRDVNITLRQFGVVVGPNGAGKSTLLQLLQFFAELWRYGGVGQFIAKSGGFHAVKSYYAESEEISLGIELNDPEHKKIWSYVIDLVGQAQGGFLVQHDRFDCLEDGKPHERLVRHGNRVEIKPAGQSHASSLVDQEIPLDSSLPLVFSEMVEAKNFVGELRRVSLWRGYAFQPNERIRAPQQLAPTAFPSVDGSDLFSAIYNLKASRKPVFRELLEIVRLAIPEFEDVEFPVVGAGHIYMSWKQRDFEKELDAGQLSDGTLRLLWLLTILFTAPDDGLVLIDEPELSLHPQWIQLLVSVLRKTSARTTVLVATQSSDFIRWIEPSELLIADVGETGTTFSWADEHPNMDKWLKDFTLSELWTMGELGGRR